MEDLGPSLSCPECRRGLFTAAFLNVDFLKKSQCPYCGVHVRWSLAPLLAILFGVLSAGSGSYLLSHKGLIPAELTMAPAAAFGVGFCLILIGLLSIKFKAVSTKQAVKRSADRALYARTL
jgi:hypothetical protein